MGILERMMSKSEHKKVIKKFSKSSIIINLSIVLVIFLVLNTLIRRYS